MRRIPIRPVRLIAAAVAVLAAVLVATGTLRAEEPAPAPAKTGIASLDWLAGAWRGTDGTSTWETCYSTPEGGQIVSASKEIRGGKTVMFDFEVFRAQGSSVVLTPYPFGKRSVNFQLQDHDPAEKEAVFLNEKHDFPRRFTYRIDDKGRLVIRLEGEQGGNPIDMTLTFTKRKS